MPFVDIYQEQEAEQNDKLSVWSVLVNSAKQMQRQPTTTRTARAVS